MHEARGDAARLSEPMGRGAGPKSRLLHTQLCAVLSCCSSSAEDPSQLAAGKVTAAWFWTDHLNQSLMPGTDISIECPSLTYPAWVLLLWASKPHFHGIRGVRSLTQKPCEVGNNTALLLLLPYKSAVPFRSGAGIKLPLHKANKFFKSRYA